MKHINFLTESSNYYKIPKLKVNITILSCPFVFELNKSCVCPNAEIMKKFNITCDIASQTLKRPGHVWIGFFKDKNSKKYQITAVSNKCQEGRCQTTNLILSQSNISNICVTGREGRFCGACASNYSLTLGPLNCVENDKACSASTTVWLVLVFIFTGILIFSFVAFFNLTVAEGTINGVLFYANCVHANLDSSIFNSSHPSFSNIFISWLNLDFGFEVCFYAGMTAYQKIWLEFGFLLYLLLLGVMIVCLSRRFVWFTRLAGHNVVPVLATVAMLAYPKLIRLFIATLTCNKHSSSKSWYSDGKYHLLWELDETIECFSGNHLLLSIFAVMMFLIALLYTLCLLLIQCLLKGSGCCMLRWVDKLRPFFDAFTGPCNDHYRFWPGLLLFVRLGMYILFAFNLIKENFEGVINAAICIFVIFLAFVYPKGVYKKWVLNVVEFLFILNFTIVSVILSLKEKEQFVYLGDISVGITVLMLVLIIFYNCYKMISKTQRWRKIMTTIKQKLNCITVDENAPLIEPVGEIHSLAVNFTAPREELLYDS